MQMIRNILRRTWQKGMWKLGFHRILPDRPSTIMIEPANICNLRCPACPTGAGKLNRPPRTMSFDEFKHVLDQALDPPGYLRQVTLFNYGEPFLCKDLLRMTRYAADKGLRTFTSSNGHFFTTDMIAEAVVASGLSELIICLDGADQETICRYRRNADFEEILQGIRRILAARARMGAATPVVELQFIVMKHNEHQSAAMRRIAEDLKVDRFIEKTVAVDASDPDFQRLADELLPRDLSASRYERLPDGSCALKGDPPPGCEYVYSTMVVNSNGDVVPCCYDVNSDFIMGNVFRQPLDEVWRGERFAAFRERFVAGRGAVRMCRHCPEGRVGMRKVTEVRS